VTITRTVIEVRNVQEANLAWALIEAVKPHLDALDRNYSFVTIGAGDTFAAICHIIKVIAAKRIPLQRGLAQQCATWIDAYAFHEQEHDLRHLIEGFLLPDAIRPRLAASVQSWSTAPKYTKKLRVRHVTAHALAQISNA
jgi:hypothetical protein